MAKIIACNWKMYLDRIQSLELAKNILYNKLHDDVELIICPSIPMLSDIARVFVESDVELAAQTCSSHTIGAFTGQVSAKMLREVGCRYVLTGHSEMRAEYKETDMQAAIKAKIALEEGVIPIICIGESLDIYQKGKTKEYLDMQLSEYAHNILENAIVAYEPLWSIGSGLVPQNAEVEEVAKFIKSKFPITSLLYGGSVASSNIDELVKIHSIDGFLIGGASTKLTELQYIVKSVKNN